MFTTLLIFWLIAISDISTISIGVIYHASLITSSNSSMTISRFNCDECLCTMFNSSIFSLNCTTNNIYSVLCQLFPDGIYLGLSSSQMKINLNSTFYFRMNNQSEITTTQMIGNMAVTTSGGMLVFQ